MVARSEVTYSRAFFLLEKDLYGFVCIGSSRGLLIYVKFLVNIYQQPVPTVNLDVDP